MFYKIIAFLSLTVQIHAHADWNYNGSTPGLEYLVRGRCYEYQVLQLQYRTKELLTDFECDIFWKKFSDVFAYKDICNFTHKYDELLAYIDNGHPIKDKVMFWSGTKEVVHDFTHVNHDYYTLEDTFSGYFADNITWCGCSSKDCNKTEGINYKNCSKSCDATTVYWNDISSNLAKKAAGITYVLLNGTGKGKNTAYFRGNHFGRYELPALGRNKDVTVLKVLIVDDLDEEPKEKCGEKSLLQLKEDATSYNLSTECIDNPKMVLDILCAKYPHARECEWYSKTEDVGTWKDAAIALIAVCGVLLLTIVVVLVMYNRKPARPTKCADDFNYKRHNEET